MADEERRVGQRRVAGTRYTGPERRKHERRSVTPAEYLSDAELKAEYCASGEEAGDERRDTLAAEMEQRGLDC